MTQTRHESIKPRPENAIGLRPDHPALSEARTIFPKSVVSPSESPRLLVSGENNVKLGKVITKGAWKDFPVYHLTLEERATCPDTCLQWASCYGNTMPFARRHSVDDYEGFIISLSEELDALEKAHPNGFAIRLHTLGDFFSVEYADFWCDAIHIWDGLHVFGFTAHLRADDEHVLAMSDSEIIAEQVARTTRLHWNRFAIRFSCDEIDDQTAVVLDSPIYDEDDIIMCPAQTGSTDCCATCGLCWSPAAKDKTIGFLQHGMTRWSPDADGHEESTYRPISEINVGRTLDEPAEIKTTIPQVVMLPLESLVVDTRYQRVILASGRSNIRHIVENFDWMHFQPILVSPVGDDKYAIVDGQHRAIAALNHPDVSMVPAAIVDLDPKQQAHVFAEINSRVIKVNALEIFWARFASGDEEAIRIMDCVEDADLKMIRVAGKVSTGEEIEKHRGTFWSPNLVKKTIEINGYGFTSAALDFVRRWDVDAPQAPNSEYMVFAVSSYLNLNSITDYEAELRRLTDAYSYHDAWKMVAETSVRDRRKASQIFSEDILIPTVTGGQLVTT